MLFEYYVVEDMMMMNHLRIETDTVWVVFFTNFTKFPSLMVAAHNKQESVSHEFLTQNSSIFVFYLILSIWDYCKMNETFSLNKLANFQFIFASKSIDKNVKSIWALEKRTKQWKHYFIFGKWWWKSVCEKNSIDKMEMHWVWLPHMRHSHATNIQYSIDRDSHWWGLQALV